MSVAHRGRDLELRYREDVVELAVIHRHRRPRRAHPADALPPAEDGGGVQLLQGIGATVGADPPAGTDVLAVDAEAAAEEAHLGHSLDVWPEFDQRLLDVGPSLAVDPQRRQTTLKSLGALE